MSTPPNLVLAAGVALGYATWYSQKNMVCDDQGALGTKNKPTRVDSPRVLVVGAGFSGICMAVKLLEKGVQFKIVEKERDVGGTWLLNRYPGCQCDVPSHGYSYSFEPNPDWTMAFAAAEEIWEYLSKVADKYGVRNHTKFFTEVLSAKWVELEKHWVVETENTKTKVKSIDVYDVLISGIGALHFPTWPQVPGIGTLNGLEVHSAEWKPMDVTGKNVVVVGSAASAVQIVPALADKCKTLTVVQRTPNWLAPQKAPVLPWSLTYGPIIHWIFRYVPGALFLQRCLVYFLMEFNYWPLGIFDGGGEKRGQKLTKAVLTKFMMHQLGNRTDLAGKVIPKYPVGCKRIIRSEKFLPALAKPNVELITDRLARVEPDGIVMAASASSPERKILADVVIYATGFKVGSLGRMQLCGSNDHLATGTSMVDSAIDTYFGICNPEYPNAFLMLGPNTGLGHNSIIFMIECQANFIARVLEIVADEKISRFTVKPEAVERSMEKINNKLETSVWSKGGCDSWYRNKDGKVPTIWPFATYEYMDDVAPPANLNHLFNVEKSAKKKFMSSAKI